MNGLLFTIALIVSCYPATAQSDEIPSFYINNAGKGILTMYSIYIFALTVLAFMSFRAKSKHPTYKRAYQVLIASLVLTIIGAIFSLVQRVLDGFTYYDRPQHLRGAFNTITGITGYWGATLQFIAVVMLLHGRHSHWVSTSRKSADALPAEKTFIIVHILLVLGLFAIGTASTGVGTHVIEMFEDPEKRLLMRSDVVIHWLQINANLQYAWTAFNVSSALDVAVLAVVAFSAKGRLGVTDKVTNIIAFALAPIFLLNELLQVAFLIVFSPVGSSITIEQRQSVSLASMTTAITFTIICYALMVVPGMWPADKWEFQHIGSLGDNESENTSASMLARA